MPRLGRIGLQTKTPYGWWWIGFSDSIDALSREDKIEALKEYLKNRSGYRIVATNRDNSLMTKPEEIIYTC